MNKTEITTKAFTAGMLGAILSGALIVVAEYAACYDFGIGSDCIGSIGMFVLIGFPLLVFLIIFLIALRKLPDQREYDVAIRKKREK